MPDDFSALENMIYSGRGIIVGMTPEGYPFVGYSLTGRSPPSQARKLVQNQKIPGSGVIRTDVTDEEQLKKGSPALLLYPAIVPVDIASSRAIVASNGAQTMLIYSTLKRSRRHDPVTVLAAAFENPFFMYDEKDDKWIDITTFEPDAPNYTPRISMCLINDMAAFHIVSRDEWGKAAARICPVDLEPGKGKFITTYKGGNESPLLPFEGGPLDVSIGSKTANGIAEAVYEAIGHGSKPGENFRVSAAVMSCNITDKYETKIINRSERGA